MRRASIAAGLKVGRNTLHHHNRGESSSSAHHNVTFTMSSSSSSPNTNIHLSRRIQHAITGLILLLISYIIPSYPIGFILLAIATIAFYYIHYKRMYDEEWDIWYIQQFDMLLRDHERGEWEETVNDDDCNSKDVTKGGAANDNSSQNQHNIKKKKRRRKTIPSLPGAFYFLLGTTISTALFTTIVARTSLLVLSIADPIAGIFGVWFTSIKLNVTWDELLEKIVHRNSNGAERRVGGPSVAGSIACGISTILCTYVFIPSMADDEHSTISTTEEADEHSITLSFNVRLCIGVVTAITEAMAGRNYHLPVIGRRIQMVDDNLLIPLVVAGCICWLNGR